MPSRLTKKNELRSSAMSLTATLSSLFRWGSRSTHQLPNISAECLLYRSATYFTISAFCSAVTSMGRELGVFERTMQK